MDLISLGEAESLGSRTLALVWAVCWAGLFPYPARGIENIQWEGGGQMGYTLGQNGQSWPKIWKEPLANPNRGGFYIRQLRVKAVIPFDSTFSAVVMGDIQGADVREAYLQKRWGAYLFTAGRFRGAGLKTGSVDEFEMTAIRQPLYAGFWSAYARRSAFRDYGIQVERAFLGGRLNNKLFFHNANLENVLNNEPSSGGMRSTQALGLDYAVDWRVSPYNTFGGHAGALANQQWDEFLGPHDFWEVGYWFKLNPIVNFSLNHQLDASKLHLLNEALLAYNRFVRVAPDSASMKSWAVSSLARYDHTPRMASFLRYEFFDPTDGVTLDDALHLITLGAEFHPSPEKYAGLKVTGEYVRTLEEGAEDRVPNDVLYVQLQMLF